MNHLYIGFKRFRNPWFQKPPVSRRVRDAPVIRLKRLHRRCCRRLLCQKLEIESRTRHFSECSEVSVLHRLRKHVAQSRERVCQCRLGGYRFWRLCLILCRYGWRLFFDEKVVGSVLTSEQTADSDEDEKSELQKVSHGFLLGSSPYFGVHNSFIG